MALVLKDRVKETTTTTGTGTLTLGGAVTGYQSFSSAIGNTNTTYYAIYLDGGSEWEVGIGTVGAGALSRDTILASSNAGSAVNFSAGQKSVWCDYPAIKAVYADASNKLRVDGNPYVDFEDATGTTVASGRMWYSNTTGAWNLGMGGGNITQQVGEELFLYGKASSAITDSPLQIVYETGTVGASGVITFAPTVSGITDGNKIVGVATESLALNAFGRVTTFGVIHGITTDGSAYGETWADGDVIWYNPVTGNPTKIKPVAPNVKVSVGTVINAGSGGSGSFQVEINHGSVLGGTDSNVQLTSPTAAQILTYDSTDSYWKNTSLASGTGISTSSNANGTLTVTNTAPDQTVALTAGTGISTSGTYPNFTITNTSPSSGGTVTSVAATAGTGISVTGSPITSSGTLTITNTAPDQTVALTAGTGISVSGTYPSFTITNTASASGDVVGPSSATDNAIVRFDSTTGKLIQNSAVTIDDTGNVIFAAALDEKVYAVVDAAGVALSPQNGTIQTWTLGASRTPTAGTWNAGESMTMMIDDGTARTITWTSLPVTWAGGTAPTLATTGFTVIELWKVGTTIYGAFVGTTA